MSKALVFPVLCILMVKVLILNIFERLIIYQTGIKTGHLYKLCINFILQYLELVAQCINQILQTLMEQRMVMGYITLIYIQKRLTLLQ